MFYARTSGQNISRSCLVIYGYDLIFAASSKLKGGKHSGEDLRAAGLLWVFHTIFINYDSLVLCWALERRERE